MTEIVEKTFGMENVKLGMVIDFSMSMLVVGLLKVSECSLLAKLVKIITVQKI